MSTQTKQIDPWQPSLRNVWCDPWRLLDEAIGFRVLRPLDKIRYRQTLVGSNEIKMTQAWRQANHLRTFGYFSPGIAKIMSIPATVAWIMVETTGAGIHQTGLGTEIQEGL
jgi:hypothetical protein